MPVDWHALRRPVDKMYSGSLHSNPNEPVGGLYTDRYETAGLAKAALEVQDAARAGKVSADPNVKFAYDASKNALDRTNKLAVESERLGQLVQPHQFQPQQFQQHMPDDEANIMSAGEYADLIMGEGVGRPGGNERLEKSRAELERLEAMPVPKLAKARRMGLGRRLGLALAHGSQATGASLLGQQGPAPGSTGQAIDQWQQAPVVKSQIERANHLSKLEEASKTYKEYQEAAASEQERRESIQQDFLDWKSKSDQLAFDIQTQMFETAKDVEGIRADIESRIADLTGSAARFAEAGASAISANAEKEAIGVDLIRVGNEQQNNALLTIRSMISTAEKLKAMKSPAAVAQRESVLDQGAIALWNEWLGQQDKGVRVRYDPASRTVDLVGHTQIISDLLDNDGVKAAVRELGRVFAQEGIEGVSTALDTDMDSAIMNLSKVALGTNPQAASELQYAGEGIKHLKKLVRDAVRLQNITMNTMHYDKIALQSEIDKVALGFAGLLDEELIEKVLQPAELHNDMMQNSLLLQSAAAVQKLGKELTNRAGLIE